MKLKTLSLPLIAIAAFATSANALTYTNDFSNPATLSDFSFAGIDSDAWSITGGALATTGPDAHIGSPGFALLNTLAGLSKFVLDVDVQIVSYARNSDRGHAGVVWGYQDTNEFNTAYLRTHANEFTIWDAPYDVEKRTAIPDDPTNGNYYHLNMQVDHDAKFLSVTVAGSTRILTGASYDAYAGSAPGKIGFITWGENVAYDNLRITSPVPDSSIGLLGCFALFSGLIGFRRFKARQN